jgi:UDP-N-acetylglucosamine diphosphorylase/glucosamine-1-phosphate N-acetyltransferase
LSRFACIFEDKRFSNFFPLSLSQPVFELRIGGRNFRERLQSESAADKFGVLCRDYLAPLFAEKQSGIMVNELPGSEVLFLNGRLICYGKELGELLDKVPVGTIAVKGGYVVAARVGVEAAVDFADYIRGRISEATIQQLCDELKGYLAPKPRVPENKRKNGIVTDKAAEGVYEDDHALGQDNVEEKLPQKLLRLIDKHNLTRVDLQGARLLSFPWQIIEENAAVIADDFKKSPFRGQSEESIIYPGVQMVAEENIVVGEGAVIRPGVVLDASSGPIIINDGATVMPNASVIGPVYVGLKSIVKTGAKILEGTSIGDVCKVGGEVDESIFAAYSNKQHDGFLGHSYLGEWVNIGAGTDNSDLKNNYSAVRMWSGGRVRETGRQFLGLIIGDHSKTAIGTQFNSGTVVGFNCNVFGPGMVDKFVPSFTWGHGVSAQPYDVERAFLTAQVVMERRDVKVGSVYRDYFEKIVDISQRCGRNI